MAKFIEILFPELIRPDDILIIDCPTSDRPGAARLDRATVADPRPDAPNSLPVLSWSGGVIGIVCEATYLEPPFDDCYWLAVETPAQEFARERATFEREVAGVVGG